MTRIREVATVFFRLGCIAFGGPAAHIAMMDEEIVEKRKWIDRQHFLDLMGVTNLIPGPNSTEMTMHCGYERAGWKGLFVAGGLFILPAVLITCLLAYLYQSYGKLPEVQPFIYGIKPAVIALILSAVYKLGKKALKSIELGILGLGVAIVSLLGVNEIIAMFCCGLLGVVIYLLKNLRANTNTFVPIVIGPLWVSTFSEENIKIFLTFLKVGALLYGSGYVLFAFLDAELVSKGLLTRDQLIDAVAVGQITPGPVLSTATFIGYQLGGLGGALAATIGIFLPSFLFVWLVNPMVQNIRKSSLLSSFLDAVNIAAVGVIVAVCIKMGQESLIDWKTILIAIISAYYLFGTKKPNSIYVVGGGAILGYLLHFIA